MEIAVAMPTYNRANYLPGALDSILGQTLKPREIFVCDDGSTDDTQSILRSYGDKIRWVTIENSGPAMARKTAIESTTAPWVALCDSDDIWMPDHLERLMGAVEIWPETDMVFSNFTLFNETGKIRESDFNLAFKESWTEFIEKSEAFFYKFGNMSYPALLRFPILLPSAQIFRRKLYEQIGGIDKAMARMVSEDAHLTLRLAAFGSVACDYEISAKIRRHEGNYSADPLRVLDGDVNIRRHLLANKLIPQHFTDCTVKDISRLKGNIFKHCFWTRDFRKARSAAWETPRAERDVMFYIRAIAAFAAFMIGK